MTHHFWYHYGSLALSLHPLWSLWSWCMKVTGKTRFGTRLQTSFPLVYTCPSIGCGRGDNSPLWNGTPLDSRCVIKRCWPLASCYVGRSDKSQRVNVLSSATVSMVLVFWFWPVHDKAFIKWTTLWRSASALNLPLLNLLLLALEKGLKQAM